MEELNCFLEEAEQFVCLSPQRQVEHINNIKKYITIINALNFTTRRLFMLNLSDSYEYIRIELKMDIDDIISNIDVYEECNASNCFIKNHKNIVIDLEKIHELFDMEELEIDDYYCGIIVNNHFVPISIIEKYDLYNFESMITDPSKIKKLTFYTRFPDEEISYKWLSKCINAEIETNCLIN